MFTTVVRFLLYADYSRVDGSLPHRLVKQTLILGLLSFSCHSFLLSAMLTVPNVGYHRCPPRPDLLSPKAGVQCHHHVRISRARCRPSRPCAESLTRTKALQPSLQQVECVVVRGCGWACPGSHWPQLSDRGTASSLLLRWPRWVPETLPQPQWGPVWSSGF